MRRAAQGTTARHRNARARADYANTLIVGSTFRPIMDQMLISREKLAFLVDATSAPIASISPISSWIGAPNKAIFFVDNFGLAVHPYCSGFNQML